ncbi:hypothetical protein CYCD_26820 [Tenuifilaceae bacterium CYCD]|nr:hypothetical protein CYCD_26820 [Tenuifilaceae bacterium CYCD]
MGKITINHYLNKSLSPRIEGNSETFPLYVQVIVNRTNYRFKSNFSYYDGYMRERDLLDPFIKGLLEREKEEIYKIVDYLQVNNQLELLNSENIKFYSEILWDVLNRKFSILFEKESKVLKATYPGCLISRNFFDIDEALTFFESSIEDRFSDDYYYCKLGMEAMRNELIFESHFQHSELYAITVFDFLHRNGVEYIISIVKKHHSFNMSTEQEENKEYGKVIDGLKKILSL